LANKNRSLPAYRLFHLASSSRVWIWGYLLVVWGIIFIVRREWVYDDPFITYRYASNLLNGLGLVYNPGERVLSTTTPFFAVILAALSPFWGNLPTVANLISALSIAAGGLLLYDIARQLDAPIVSWTGLLLYPISTLLLNTMSSETPLYIACCLATFAFYFRGNYPLTAIFSAAAVLIRPDGILIPALLCADYLIRNHRSQRPVPWKSIGLFAAVTVPWFMFLWVYFGSPIPATLAAKQNQGSMAISSKFSEGIIDIGRTYLDSWYSWLQIWLAVFGFVFFPLRAKEWAVFLLWPVIYFAGYSLLGITTYFWYYAPLVPGFIVLTGLGITALTHGLGSLLGRRGISNTTARILSKGLPVILLLVMAIPMGINAYDASQEIDPRYSIYRKASIWLQRNTPPGSLVGTLEVGVIGYYSERPMVDFAGLLQPPVAAFLQHETTYDDAAVFAVEQYHPRYIVLNEGSLMNLENNYVTNHCTLEKRFEGPRYRARANVVIFNCGHP
jgi:hypothetical protein